MKQKQSPTLLGIPVTSQRKVGTGWGGKGYCSNTGDFQVEFLELKR